MFQAGKLTALSGCPCPRFFCSQYLLCHQALAYHIVVLICSPLTLRSFSWPHGLLSSQNISQVHFLFPPPKLQDPIFFLPEMWHKLLMYLLDWSLTVPSDHFAEGTIFLPDLPCWELWSFAAGTCYIFLSGTVIHTSSLWRVHLNISHRLLSTEPCCKPSVQQVRCFYTYLSSRVMIFGTWYLEE